MKEQTTGFGARASEMLRMYVGIYVDVLLLWCMCVRVCFACLGAPDELQWLSESLKSLKEK